VRGAGVGVLCLDAMSVLTVCDERIPTNQQHTINKDARAVTN